MTAEEWYTAKSAAREIFQDWGKRLAQEDWEGIRIVSDAIPVLSSTLSQGPSIATALAHLRKELHQLLNKKSDKLRATARAERWERETWCSRHVLPDHNPVQRPQPYN